MKKLFTAIFIICFLWALLLFGAGCTGGDGAELLSVSGFTVKDGRADITVHSGMDKFSFIDKIKVSDGASFKLFYDQGKKEQIIEEIVPLDTGANIFYLTVTSGNKKAVGEYTLNVYRKAYCTIKFLTGNGVRVKEQFLEEGALAKEPNVELARQGYAYGGWDYDFSKPISGDLTVSAIWIANTDTPYKVEYYLQNEDLGFSLDKTENFIGTTDEEVFAEIYEYSGYTFASASSVVSGNIAGDGSLALKIVYWNDAAEKVVIDGKVYDKIGKNDIELISDKSFSTGINVLGLYPSDTGRNVMGRLDYEGTAKDNSDIDPWTYAQWYATPSIINLEDGSLNGTYREDGDYIYYENDCKTIRINKSENEIYLGLDATKIDSQYILNIEWPHALMEKEFAYSPRFSELESMRASMNFCVENYHKDQGTAVQVTWWFFVTDRDYDEDDGQNDCWLGFTLFDSRWDTERVNREETEMKLSWEQNTKDATVKVSRSYYSDVLANQTEVGKEYSVSFDVKELFGVAIEALSGKYPNFNVDPENFRILNFNIGWEMPFFEGQVGVRVSDISLVAEGV